VVLVDMTLAVAEESQHRPGMVAQDHAQDLPPQQRLREAGGLMVLKTTIGAASQRELPQEVHLSAH